MLCSSIPKAPSLSLASHSDASPEPDNVRYSLRRRSPVGESSGETKGAILKMPRLVSVKADTRRASSSKRKANPLDALLKEKREAEKRGGGSEALAAAEATVKAAKLKKKRSRSSFGLGSQDVAASGDDDDPERMSSKCMRERSRRSHDDEDGDDDDVELDADYRKLLAHKGQAVSKILESDRQGVAARERKPKPVKGVPLWIPPPLHLSTSKRTVSNRISSLPALPFEEADIEGNLFLSTLNTAVNRSGTLSRQRA